MYTCEMIIHYYTMYNIHVHTCEIIWNRKICFSFFFMSFTVLRRSKHANADSLQHVIPTDKFLTHYFHISEPNCQGKARKDQTQTMSMFIFGVMSLKNKLSHIIWDSITHFEVGPILPEARRGCPLVCVEKVFLRTISQPCLNRASLEHQGSSKIKCTFSNGKPT